MREIASGLQFPEGPIAMPDGSLLVVEIQRGTLSRVTPDGRVTGMAETGGGPNGAAVGPDDKIYVCNNGGFEWHQVAGFTVPGNQPPSYRGGSIQRVDLGSGRVETVYTECDGHPLRGPNDLVFDSDGGFWFTDHGKLRERERDRTGLFYARPDGSMIREVVHPLDGPNGVGLSPDGKRGYAAQTWSACVELGRGAAGRGRSLDGVRSRGRLAPLRSAGIPALRLARRRRGRERMRRDARHRGDHGDRAQRRRAGAGVHRRSAHHQRLLR